MKIGLRDRFQPQTALRPDEDPLVRLGGLYRFARQPDTQTVKQGLLNLLPASTTLSAAPVDPEVYIFTLHAAILLSEQGAGEGPQWILDRIRATASREQRTLAETALSNCTQFPIAVLLTQAVQLDSPQVSSVQLASLMACSDEELSELAEAPEDDQHSRLAELDSQLVLCTRGSLRPGRAMALGTIISRPLQVRGCRYTGFVAVERPNQRPLLVPYDMTDVLNQDRENARQSVWEMIGQPGRQAIVVYSTNEPIVTLTLYALPFAPMSRDGMNRLSAQLAHGSEGGRLAVVVDWWSDDHGGHYRMVTALGEVLAQSYRADRQKIGDCLLYHPLNDRGITTRYRLAQTDLEEVLRLFTEALRQGANTDVEMATHYESKGDRHHFVTHTGAKALSLGEEAPAYVYMAEDSRSGKYAYSIPGTPWERDDRSQVWAGFFANQPDAFGVVLETLTWRDGTLRARTVRAGTGEIKLKPIDAEVAPGTVVLWDTNEEGKTFATVIPDQQIVGGCQDCYGTEYRICAGCQGTGRILCPECDGSRRITCADCDGTGRVTCGQCSGTGQITKGCFKCEGTGEIVVPCNNCETTGTFTGTCKVCEGRGYYADSGRPCKACHGQPVFSGPCRACEGTGWKHFPCRRCGGNGSWVEECRGCSGSGLRNCFTCYGQGNVLCSCGHGQITCPTCNGNRVAPCYCGGQDRGQIAPAV
jgi:hypothetical protein